MQPYKDMNLALDAAKIPFSRVENNPQRAAALCGCEGFRYKGFSVTDYIKYYLYMLLTIYLYNNCDINFLTICLSYKGRFPCTRRNFPRGAEFLFVFSN
jgi:hypothetical protein